MRGEVEVVIIFRTAKKTLLTEDMEFRFDRRRDFRHLNFYFESGKSVSSSTRETAHRLVHHARDSVIWLNAYVQDDRNR